MSQLATDVRDFHTYTDRISVYRMKAGDEIILHKHLFDHWAFVTHGRAVMFGASGEEQVFLPEHGPKIMPANLRHGFRALEDGTIFVNVTSLRNWFSVDLP